MDGRFLLASPAMCLLVACAIDGTIEGSDGDQLDELEAGGCPTQNWAPGVAFGWHPFWPNIDGKPGIDPIPVRDRFVRTLTDETTAKKWRTIRNQALLDWQDSGVRFRITEVNSPCPNYPAGGFPWPAGEIQLCRNTFNTESEAAWSNTYRGGFVFIYPDSVFFRDYQLASSQGRIAHEVGHSIGFGHSANTPGVMGGGWRVSDIEKRMARNYYFNGCMKGADEASDAPPSCVPATCAALGQTCGSWPDGCGGTADCGDCPPDGSGDSCDAFPQDTCSFDDECCQGECNDHGRCCLPAGEPGCSADSDCCNSGGYGGPNQCDNGGTCCRPVGYSCSSDAECCAHHSCSGGTCQ